MIQYSQRISVVYISIIRVKILELISAIDVQVPNLNTTTKDLSIYSTCVSSSLRHITAVSEMFLGPNVPESWSFVRESKLTALFSPCNDAYGCVEVLLGGLELQAENSL